MSVVSSTTVEAEKTAQRLWRLRPQCDRLDWFDKLVAGEFLAPPEQHARAAAALAAAVHHAASSVPYYARLFETRGITADAIRAPADLQHIPPLTRASLQANQAQLRAVTLPAGHQLAGPTKTSGSTGQPVSVLQTNHSARMFGLLKQREYRWFRFDPTQSLAIIREIEELPGSPDGEATAESATRQTDRWRHVGVYFQTGPCLSYAYTNPLEDQMRWLDEHQPGYLLSMSATLEHLALGYQERSTPGSLRGLVAISQQLTPGMRARIESVFRLPVQQNYGLNEVGLVAARCPEAGRYHVHSEHCLIEIVDDAGRPCGPGETGHLLVTCLTNRIMPLLRYDTGDLATGVDGPCPCGRTLPSFGGIKGRYRRIAPLPPGTWNLWEAVERAVGDMPAELAAPLRQYQLHQFRDGRFTLRLAAAAPLPQDFMNRVRRAWNAQAAGQAPPLEIVQVRQIPPGRGRKFESFISDFALADDASAG